MIKRILFICCLFCLKMEAFSQTIPVGTYAEELARMNQLLGKSDDISSFTQHPLNSAFNSKGDSALQSMIASKNLLPWSSVFGIPVAVKILPFNWLNENNTKLPYGYNNGPLYPNQGYQTEYSGGIYIKAGILNVQFKPEFVYVENRYFPTFADVQANYNSPLIPYFFAKVNGIDLPERFGPYNLRYNGLGQSKITLIYHGVEAGVSTENMWWGPGVQNSIMMSNSAPGFFHWTFNSSNPIVTPAGSFEWQIIGGRLQQSGFLSYDPYHFAFFSNNLYYPKPKVDRYLSAFTFNWHPKWIEGLFVGVSGYDYMNRDSAYNHQSFAKKYLPVLAGSSAAANEAGNGDGEDFAYAINIRQLLTKYNAEIYFEYARNDRPGSLTDLFLEFEQASAYTVGGARIFNIAKNQYIQIRSELTHMQVPDNFLVRPEPSWYVHVVAPRDGYTNLGRMVGAGVGPGGNSLMFDISYVRNMSSVGMKFERYVHDADLYYQGNAGQTNFVSNWVDFSDTMYANIKGKHFLVAAEYTPIYTYNYEYLQGYSLHNTHYRLNLTYYF